MTYPPVFLRPRFLYLASCLYLLLPFLLFILGWVKLVYALPIAIILLYYVVISYRDADLTQPIDVADMAAVRKNWLIGGGVLLLWLLFSGVGNLAYQNFDYDVRNAVMRDLVQQPWPVSYQPTIYPPDRQFTHDKLLLVYYFGYWLPAALVGKFAGLTAANLFLFAWAFLGLLLIFASLSQALKKVSYKAVVLLLIWSGLDIVGILYAKLATTDHVELNLLTHIERWANHFGVFAQFSSITTLLYWVFNQTIPVWLIVLLFINDRNPKTIFLLLSLALFLAPIGTLGFGPLVLLRLGQQVYRQGFPSVLHRYLSVANTAGTVAVLGVTVLFFAMNRAGSLKSLVFFPVLPYGVFLFLEAGLLTALLYVFSRRRLVLVCLAMLCVIPLVKLGRFYDFGMRASIAYLFILCLLTIQFMLDKRASRQGKLLMCVYMLVGVVTPFLEITRSVFFSVSHALYLTSETLKANHLGQLIPSSVQAPVKDRDFLYDHIKTFSRHNKDIETIVDQYIGESKNNLFADYLLRKPADFTRQEATPAPAGQ